MTIVKEMLLTLFDQNTINKAKELFSSNKKILPIDSFDMDFRLFKPTPNNVNLELLIKKPLENMKEMKVFFKPIGFYTQKDEISPSDIMITVLKEFENELASSISNNELASSVKFTKLSLKENAVLAAFSMETVIEAMKYKDVSNYNSNGLWCDIFMTHDNEYPQVFLNDLYGIEGAIGAYFMENPNSVNPMVEYKELFDKFIYMSLLSAFKAV